MIFRDLRDEVPRVKSCKNNEDQTNKGDPSLKLDVL